MADVASLLDSVSDLACVRCGRRGVDDFTDRGGVQAFLDSTPQIPVLTAGPIPPGIGIRVITADSLLAYGPVHTSCVRPPPRRPGNSSSDGPPYNLLDSVR